MTNENRIKYNSILHAVLIAESNVCVIINSIFNIPNISVTLMICTCLLAMTINGGRFFFKTRIKKYYFITLILLLFSILLNDIKYVSSQLLFFLTFGTTSMILISVDAKREKIQENIIRLYVIYFIVYFLYTRGNFLNSEDFALRQMGVAYSVVPAFMCSVIEIFRLKKNHNNKLKIINLSLSVLTLISSLFVILFDCFTRGAIFSVLLGLIIAIWRETGKYVRVTFSILAISVVILVYTNSEYVTKVLFDKFANSEIIALRKFERMEEAGDISNGRFELYDMSKQMIKDNPLFGYGVGFYEKVTHVIYPHQIFLELMISFGIFGLIIYIRPIVLYIKKTINDSDNGSYSFNVMLFTSMFLPLLFSSSFWLLPGFWYLFFYTLKYTTYDKHNSSNIQRRAFSDRVY